MELSWTAAPMTFILAGAGAYLGAYLRKKGENLATHEDIDKLNDQVRSVTQITEEIKAKISNEVWDRQKHWELKREVLLQAAKRLAKIDDVMTRLVTFVQLAGTEPTDRDWTESWNERLTAWQTASAEFDEARLFAEIVCDKETREALNAFAVLTAELAMKIVTKNNPPLYSESRAKLVTALARAREALRKELGID
jgi:hypothetical protein